MARRRLTAIHVLAGLACAGFALVVLGSFLPWFRSGGVLRNSYETTALIGHLAMFENPLLNAALRAWIAVPLLCTACAALYLLRLFRSAATLSIVLAIIVGTVSAVMAVQDGGTQDLVGIATAGPWTTTVGAITTLIGGIGILAAKPGGTARPRTEKSR